MGSGFCGRAVILAERTARRLSTMDDRGRELREHYLHVEDVWQADYLRGSPLYDSLARAEDQGDRLLEGLVRHTTGRGKRLLEVGCGTGRYTKPLAKLADEVIALDIYPGQVEAARTRCRDVTNIRFAVGDGAALPLADESVDMTFEAYAFGAMTTREMQDAAFGEMLRVVRPGSDVWITAPIGGDLLGFGDAASEASQRADVSKMTRRYGLTLVDEVATETRFSGMEEARSVLAHFFGDVGAGWIAERKTPVLSQRIALMRRTV